ncbi:alanine/glycine:cation symporter family protein [Brevibacillus choshinensis]|nr:amino acid carrier protein [Brevibacillus choshinensis]
MLEKIVNSVVKVLWDVPMPFAILFAGFYFTMENRFFQLHHLRQFFQQVLVSIRSKSEGIRTDGALSSFHAGNIAIGCLVGVGCIGGVATAISIGGPGAVFWMWVAAFVGMIIKMAEVTLSVYYRTRDEEGNRIGGPTVYIEKGIGEEMNVRSWKILVVLFVAGMLAPVFISIQNYVASTAISSTFNLNIIWVSLLFAVMVYGIIMRGLPFLRKVFKIVIPLMILSYLFLGCLIIVMNLEKVIPALELIMQHAFLGSAALGGFAGATLSQVITMGVSQAVYTSEFGWGTTPVIHSTADVDHPVKQGLWGGFEVFLTSVVICGITAFVVILSGDWVSGRTGIDLALHSFELTLGTTGKYLVTIILFLFALTTASGWYANREIMVKHLCQKNPKLKRHVLRYVKVFCAFPEFLFVVYVVTFHFPDKDVWLMTGIMTAVPTFINMFLLLILSHQFKKLVLDYKARYLKIGKIDEEMLLFYEDKKVELQERELGER